MTNKPILILSLLLSFCTLKSKATIRYVDSAHVGGMQDGASWATAFSKFQTGIDSARSGDSIWVAKGTYLPAATYTFVMKDGIKVLGGFLNTYTSIAQRNPVLNATVLKGNGNQVIVNSFLSVPLTAATLLDGVTITGGYGGGMENTFSSPTINNCIFADNNGLTDGAALQNAFCNPLITNCSFLNNTGEAAVVNGGLGAFPPANSAGPVFINCVFTGNTGNTAGGVANAACITSFTNCVFTGNTCTADGGGMNSEEAVITLTNCTFNYNSAPTGVGGGLRQKNCIANITNCGFGSNIALTGGGLLNQCDSAQWYMNLKNSSFSNNKATITGSRSVSDLYGGGIYNRNRANIDSCTFSNNTAGYLNSGAAGGGLYSYSNDTTMPCNVTNSNFYNNKATVTTFDRNSSSAYGGGATGYYLHISRCLFSGNDATVTGGGFAAYTGSTVTNCVFTQNRAWEGGGVFGTSSVKVANCLFSKNIADSLGGGVFLDIHQNFPITIANNTISQNSAVYGGGGIFFSSYATITMPYAISNTIVYANTSGIGNLASMPAPIVAYSLVQGMPADAVRHNLDGNANPLFVDTAAGIYQLLPASPCINAGRNDSLPAVYTTDLANHARIYNSTIDMGAYEYGLFMPQVNLGKDTAICTNSPLLLTAPYMPATSYLWNTGDTASFIKVSGAGTYYVTVTNTLGTARDTIIVAQHTAPVVNLGPDTAICTGNSFILNAQHTGMSFLWSTGSTYQTISAAIAGTYSVAVTDSNNCVGRDTISVATLPLPIVSLGNDVAIAPGSSITLNAHNAGSTYVWNTGATTQTITVSAAGTYTVIVTNTRGCSKSDAIRVSIETEGLNLVNGPQTITVSPNPAQEFVTVHITDQAALHTQAILADVSGRILRTIVLDNKTQPLSLNGLVPGIYILKIGTGQAIKIVKQ